MTIYLAKADNQILGRFKTEKEAVCCCVNKAVSSGDMCGESQTSIKKALLERGFYMVGYSHLELEVEAIES